jgi:microcystin-dependent protein
MSGSIKVGGNTIATHTGAQGAGEVTLGTNLRLPASGGIQDSSGNNILTESGGNVSVGNIRLPASGGIKDSSGNNILTESGGTVTFGNVIGGVPAGAIMSFAMSSAPTGWIVCNGAEYAIADYGDLHTAIGTTWGALTNGSGGAGSSHFRVPDLRGEFLRGFDNGQGNDPDAGSRTGGDAVGSSQGDALKSHNHTYTTLDGQTLSAGTQNYRWSSASASWAYSGNVQTQLFGIVAAGTSSENRPRNKYVQYCIKY